MGKGKIYPKFLEKILDSVYERIEEPRKSDYCQAVAEYRNNENSEKGNTSKIYTKRSVHSAVEKAIDDFVENGKMVKIGDNIFVPNNKKYQKKIAEEYIIENLILSSNVILDISPKLYALKVEEEQLSDKTHVKKLKEAFEVILGEEYYNVCVVANVILLMVYSFDKSQTEEIKRFRRSLNKVIGKAWDFRHPPKEITETNEKVKGKKKKT